MTRVAPAVLVLAAAFLSACKDKPAAIPEEPASLSANPAAVTALAAQPVATAMQIVVRDENGTGVPGETVTFAVAEGGGSISTTTAVSGAGGVVNVPTWTFGKSAVQQRLRATLGSLTADITGNVQTSYDIVVKFYGPAMTPQQQAVFTTAAARLRAIITGDLLPVQMNATLTGCSEETINEVVDDVVIYASVQPMDGPGDVLAAAGPCFIRNDNDLPVVGVMQFDEDDLADITALGILPDVIIHEMLHVLGIGSIWETKSLVTGAGTANPQYTGAQARVACQAIGGSAVCGTTVPVENLGGPGSADAHWRESVFGRELMTSGSSNNPPMPLSRMTIGGLADLGYTVNNAAFDTYTVSANLRMGAVTAAASPSRWEGAGPRIIRRVDAAGNVTGMRIRQ